MTYQAGEASQKVEVKDSTTILYTLAYPGQVGPCSSLLTLRAADQEATFPGAVDLVRPLDIAPAGDAGIAGAGSVVFFLDSSASIQGTLVRRQILAKSGLVEEALATWQWPSVGAVAGTAPDPNSAR